MADPAEPLTEEQLTQIDAEYVPFKSFTEWDASVPRTNVWTRRLADMDATASAVDEDSLRAAIDVAVRAAALDTGAIEGLYTTDRGLTMTVAQQGFAWEQQLAAHGGDAVALFKAQLASYELVLDVAAERMPVSEAWIRGLHEQLTEPQETYTVHTPIGVQQLPLPRGEYKKHPNHVRLQDGTVHAYAPVDATRDEMQRLVRELASDGFQAAHPILQAAYAHHAFVSVHPFADGNGRVARGLASVYLYRAGRVPFLMFADQRDQYFDALEHADRGESLSFNQFVANAGIAAVELVTDSILAGAAPSAQAAATDLKTLVTAQGGLGHPQIDALAAGLAAHFQRIVQEEFGKLSVSDGIQFNPSAGSGGPPSVPDGYRAPVVSPQQFVGFSLHSPGPSLAARNARLRVFISKDLDEEADLFWLVQEGTGTGTKFSLMDVHPVLTAVAEQRLRMLAQRILGVEMRELADEAAQSMRTSGYLG